MEPMSHDFVDQMMDKSKAGELRSPVSETLGMHLVSYGRGEAVYEMDASEQLGNPLGVIQGGVATARLVWSEADVLADGELVGKFASTGIRVAFDPASYIAERGSSDE
jgi:hypothetical protein